MSTDVNELLVRTRSAGLKASSTGFICLPFLAVLWPAPVVWVNDATIDAPLAVDERSFLGREAPAWDVVFWGIAGIFALAIVHARIGHDRLSLSDVAADFRAIRGRIPARLRALTWRHAVLVLSGAAAVAAVWIFLDAPLIALVELGDKKEVHDVARLANRLGGGMNPTMIIIFFAFAGVIFFHRKWVRYAFAMILAGLAGGLVIHVLKVLVGRTRPELWLGPFHHSGPLASSFPSGHTVSAFAIAAVLLFGSRSVWLRVISVTLATLVAASRVISFRHWPSDVFASACIGLFLGWFFVTALQRHEAR